MSEGEALRPQGGRGREEMGGGLEEKGTDVVKKREALDSHLRLPTKKQS